MHFVSLHPHYKPTTPTTTPYQSKKEIAKNAICTLICSTLLTIRHNFWTNTPQNLFNSLIINHATFLWHFCTNFPIPKFSKIYYKKFLVLGFVELAISKVHPIIQKNI